MRTFARCGGCGHAGVQRAACGLCGGVTHPEPAPGDLFTGWRCQCYHCVATPC